MIECVQQFSFPHFTYTVCAHFSTLRNSPFIRISNVDAMYKIMNDPYHVILSISKKCSTMRKQNILARNNATVENCMLLPLIFHMYGYRTQCLYMANIMAFGIVSMTGGWYQAVCSNDFFLFSFRCIYRWNYQQQRK